MRKNGLRVLNWVWNFLCDLVEIVIVCFKMIFNPRRYALKARIIGLPIAFVLTVVTFTKVVFNSIIGSGMLYGIMSIQKRIGILWASEGDWGHWMSGGRYLLFKSLKEDLIANDKFASFLSSLAGHGPALKIVQVTLIMLCFAAVIFLIYVACKCVCTFVQTIKTMNARKRQKSAKTVVLDENGNIISFVDSRKKLRRHAIVREDNYQEKRRKI